MITHPAAKGPAFGPSTPREEAAAASLAALAGADRIAKREAEDALHAGDWDAVCDASLESFPASDAPSWSSLRVGPPAGHRLRRARG